MEKLKEQKKSLPGQKKKDKGKGAKTSKADKDKGDKGDKGRKEKEKKLKEQISILKKKIEEIGTQLLVDLVNLMKRKGMLNSLVSLDSLGDPYLVLVAGSVCKDWSSMGKGEGFCGKWVLLAALMMALCLHLQPLVFFHECTIRFPFDVFAKILGKTHLPYHTAITPTEFGAPVQRKRSYDAVAAWLAGMSVGAGMKIAMSLLG
eukprot:s1023_g27.t1